MVETHRIAPSPPHTTLAIPSLGHSGLVPPDMATSPVQVHLATDAKRQRLSPEAPNQNHIYAGSATATSELRRKPGPIPQIQVRPGITVCQNCMTTTTPLWRRDENGQIMCNACGLFLKLHGRKRPISLKTDVIKSRNRSNRTNKAASKRMQVQMPLVVAPAQSPVPKETHYGSISNPPGLERDIDPMHLDSNCSRSNVAHNVTQINQQMNSTQIQNAALNMHQIGSNIAHNSHVNAHSVAQQRPLSGQNVGVIPGMQQLPMQVVYPGSPAINPYTGVLMNSPILAPLSNGMLASPVITSQPNAVSALNILQPQPQRLGQNTLTRSQISNSKSPTPPQAQRFAEASPSMPPLESSKDSSQLHSVDIEKIPQLVHVPAAEFRASQGKLANGKENVKQEPVEEKSKCKSAQLLTRVSELELVNDLLRRRVQDLETSEAQSRRIVEELKAQISFWESKLQPTPPKTEKDVTKA